ncbi:DUF4097 family beta strand repeat-containing protein [Nocardiopsis alba]|uniref:hypothetical protein n=1 Tax=Nocardiopsis alba TaxID=53437 RepID=UPI0036317939
MSPWSVRVATAALCLTLTAGCSSSPELGPPEERVYDLVPEPLVIEGDFATIDLVPSEREGLRVTREDSGQAGGEWGLEGDTLTLGADCSLLSECRVRYEVALPAWTTTTIRTDGGPVSATGLDSALQVNTDTGAIAISDVSGPIDLTSNGGAMRLDRIRSGVVRAATDTGAIDASLVERPEEVEVSTNSGTATIVLPEGPYAVFETPGNGEILAEVSVDDSADATVNARTENSRITLRPHG